MRKKTCSTGKIRECGCFLSPRIGRREYRCGLETIFVQFRLQTSKTRIFIGDCDGGAGGNRTNNDVEDAQIADSTKQQIREKQEKP
jgi:hypothetical protein